jgi:hypothetical protein
MMQVITGQFILRRVKDPYGAWQRNWRTFLTKFLPSLPLGESTSGCQRAQVGELGMIRTQVRTHNRSENRRSAWDALYDATPQQ